MNESVDVMVPPQEILRLEKSLRRLNMEKLLMIDDVERYSLLLFHFSYIRKELREK